jgi:hypothetical protein
VSRAGQGRAGQGSSSQCARVQLRDASGGADVGGGQVAAEPHLPLPDSRRL